jgi:hypothetical protein
MIEPQGKGGGAMKIRIAIWAAVGALVVAFWALYIMTTHQNVGAGGVGRVIVCLTCPIAIEGHHPQSLYFVMVVNAATYALVGIAVETIRRHLRLRSIPN